MRKQVSFKGQVCIITAEKHESGLYTNISVFCKTNKVVAVSTCGNKKEQVKSGIVKLLKSVTCEYVLPSTTH